MDSTPYDAMVHNIMNRLYGAISCRCDSRPAQEMRLGLSFFSLKNGSVDLLLHCGKGEDTFWHSVRIHIPITCDDFLKRRSQMSSIYGKAPLSKAVSSVVPVEERYPWRRNDPLHRGCLCTHVKKMESIGKTLISHIEVDDQNLLQQHNFTIGTDFPKEWYNLPDLFFAISRTETGKVFIGMQLVHALSSLYDGDWLIRRWHQENISLFKREDLKRGERVPCKPWLRVPLPPDHGLKTVLLPEFNHFPQVLELGTILLQLHIGETVECFLGYERTEDADQKWVRAWTVFEQIKNHILSDDYRHALEYCLWFSNQSSSEAVQQPELIRRSLYENVFVRLESTVVRSGMNQKSLEELDLSRMMRSPSPTASNQPLRSPGGSPRQPANMTSPLPLVQADEDNIVAEIEEAFELFGSEFELQPNQEQSRASDAWVESFRGIVDSRLKRESEKEGGKSEIRVKVAVLDTGIDLKHIDFRGEYKAGKVKSVCSWVEGARGAEDPEAGDISGHGTFISSLLLHLGRRIDLYVARVSKSKDFKPGTSENIANALHHARTEWQVDIITMSFGYPRGVKCIKEQITRAIQNDILVFAAASNDGVNRPRMYPARQCGVFAIHSTDCYGVVSPFSPNPEPDDNFSILGEGIKSAWLTNTGSASIRRLSGTSFATPVAVCLSAFIITYVHSIFPGHEKSLHKLRSYEGMRNIFRLMAYPRNTIDGQTYRCLSLERYFGDKKLHEITGDIEKALST